MYALCDQRSFYASCESVFRPDIRGQSIIVLSNNDGCVIAQNEQAKAAGVKKFEPYFLQKSLIESKKVNCFSSNYALYGAISDRIMDTLRAHTPSVEVYSCDEGFCDLSGIPIKHLKPLGQKLRNTVWVEQRIPMGVSIGPTKTIAKLGQYATKKIPQINGVAVLTEQHQWEWLAKRVAVDEVWGVGRRLKEKLQAVGVMTAYDLSQLSLGAGRKIGGLALARTISELNGDPCIPFELNPPSKQQILSSRSFGTKLYRVEELLEAVSSFAIRGSEKLRAQESLAGRLSVTLIYGENHNERKVRSASINIPSGTDDIRYLAREATAITRQLFKAGERYLKAGIELTDIRPKQYWQRDFLATEEAASLMPAIDQINKRFGRNTVTVARHAGPAAFGMRREMLSPSYLTQWSNIPKIQC